MSILRIIFIHLILFVSSVYVNFVTCNAFKACCKESRPSNNWVVVSGVTSGSSREHILSSLVLAIISAD